MSRCEYTHPVAKPRYVATLSQWRHASAQTRLDWMRRQRKMDRVVKRARHATTIAVARDEKVAARAVQSDL